MQSKDKNVENMTKIKGLIGFTEAAGPNKRRKTTTGLITFLQGNLLPQGNSP